MHRISTTARVPPCRADKSVVFVLAHFHLFMRRARPTTIYNLLDALQALHVCAAVIGVSEDQGAVDLMEKRARSRFSHRKLVLQRPQGGPHSEARVLSMLQLLVLLGRVRPVYAVCTPWRICMAG